MWRSGDEGCRLPKSRWRIGVRLSLVRPLTLCSREMLVSEPEYPI